MASKRKLIGFDPETWQALDLLSRDSGKSIQELADEAFADLLIKHHRPRTLKDALKQSSRVSLRTRTSRRSDIKKSGCAGRKPGFPQQASADTG
jgi:hypothetical protein